MTIKYSKKHSGKFYVERKTREIARLLVKICEENDDRAGQALSNALNLRYGNCYYLFALDLNGEDFEEVMKKYKAHDVFQIEDSDLLKILQAYYKSSKQLNREVQKAMK
jgi:signal transduction histidine kinase